MLDITQQVICIRSYREALELLCDYIKCQKHIPLQDVTFEMLNADMINGFLAYLEENRGCSVTTRNNRLAAIRAFLVFSADRDLTTVVQLDELKKVPVKKLSEIEAVDHMSMDAIAAIVEQTDDETPKGLRDRTFMILLYDTGARLQEMIDIKVCDLHFGKTPTITLHGKLGKIRSVPLMERTVQHLQTYLTEFHANRQKNEESLFYVESRGARHPMSASCIRLFLSQYAKAAHKQCPEAPENAHPHLWRHSRAMHLYQEGMDLTLVSQWLGHAQIETTLIYAHADTEHKRKAIAAATPADNPLSKKLNPKRFTISDDDTLKRLTGLR